MRRRRVVPEWEQHCGCPTCRVKPGQRCVTVRPLHMRPTERELAMVGAPTAPHQARYLLWLHLWGKR
jgi:hypothetical protein